MSIGPFIELVARFNFVPEAIRRRVSAIANRLSDDDREAVVRALITSTKRQSEIVDRGLSELNELCRRLRRSCRNRSEEQARSSETLPSFEG